MNSLILKGSYFVKPFHQFLRNKKEDMPLYVYKNGGDNEVKTPKGRTLKGKGIDIGTMFVKCALKQGKETVFKSQRSAFFEIENTDSTKKIFDNSKARYIVKDDKLCVVGDEALEFSNMFKKEPGRPLSRGVINPLEKEALPMLELLIKSVIDKPTFENETVYFSVPGNPLDADFNAIYHARMIERFLHALGYTPRPINEAHAVILSELADEDFTGIGLSFGGSMVNVCLSFMSVPIFKFSITKAGNWIDQQVAMAYNVTVSHVSAIKESSFALSNKRNLSKIEKALSFYYNRLIEYVIENINIEFNKADKIPQITKPISIVLSGGTSLPKGFLERFKKILNHLKLPFPVKSIRRASQPLRSVAKGALVAAGADESRRQGTYI